MDTLTGKPQYRGTKALSHALDIVTRPVFLKRGFAQNRIITDWSQIVGSAISASSVPRKLVFQKDKKTNGILHVEISNSGFATEIVYLEPMILERIACYFGYKAVSKLKILQNLQSQKNVEKPKVQKQEISAENNAAIELALADIEDGELKESLRNLGKTISQK